MNLYMGCPILSPLLRKGGIEYRPCQKAYNADKEKEAENATSLPVVVINACHSKLTHTQRDLFLKILEEVRQKYDFVVWGYVVMPEHFHLLISEPSTGTVAKAMQVLKQRVSYACHKRNPPSRVKPTPFWLPRYYDFNVFTERKHIEKLRYMHRNPVKRGLVESPELWIWSSFRHYWFGEIGLVKIGTETRLVVGGSK